MQIAVEDKGSESAPDLGVDEEAILRRQGRRDDGLAQLRAPVHARQLDLDETVRDEPLNGRFHRRGQLGSVGHVEQQRVSDVVVDGGTTGSQARSDDLQQSSDRIPSTVNVN